ncbi:MAG: tripartite tricarboxylate transporter substrate binding protein [Hydrogenophaga sp.]|nr:tripartite tricarboxylate transporter substrate binding protein [Hydrogenophaga sp.]
MKLITGGLFVSPLRGEAPSINGRFALRRAGETRQLRRLSLNTEETSMIRVSHSTTPATVRRLMTIGAAVALVAAALPAAAQTTVWPNKPVRLVVGFAAGGGTDVMARALAHSLTETLGQAVIVENKPGASGNLSASEVTRAAPDGYTFLVAPTSVETANPYLFKSTVLPSRDLTPVMAIGRMQMYVVARPTLPVKDVKELVALAKAQPGKLNYASSGPATPPHLAGELFKQSTGTFITHIPYRGSSPALQDVMGGQADFVFDPGIAFPHIKSGKVKLLGVASDRKSPFFPDAPTYADLGIKNASMDIWFGVWAPNKVPTEIVEHLSREITKALATPAIKQRFNNLGAEPAPLETVAFKKLLADEGKTLSALIKDRKISVD